jgi:hypothetical protein
MFDVNNDWVEKVRSFIEAVPKGMMKSTAC